MNRQVLALGGLWLTCTVAFGATCINKDGKTIPVRAADKAEYFPVRDWWPNPHITVTEGDGFTIALSPSMKREPGLTFEEALTRLDHLSCDQWKFGAVVFLGENGLHSPASDDRMEEDMLRLKDALERKGIVVILVPSA